MTTQILKTEIMICGGGIAGLVLAALLTSQGIHVTLADPSPLRPDTEPGMDGRTSALMMPAIDTLRRLPAWKGMEASIAPLQAMRLINDGAESLGIKSDVTFSAATLGLEAFGYNVPNALLRNRLLSSQADQPGLTLLPEAKVADFATGDHGVSVWLSDNREVQTRLLIGADGRHSTIRGISGIKTWKTEYGQSAITCIISHSRPHQNISTEIHRPGGPFTMVPLPGQTSSIVWVEKQTDADRIMALRRDDFIQTLQDRTKGLLGEISLETPPQAWPLIAMSARRLTAHRVALTAEAAHVLHPIGAQGLNLSLGDVALLADLVVEASRLGLDIGSRILLDRYESARRTAIHGKVASVHLFSKLVSNNNPLLGSLRVLGIEAVSALPLVREHVMKAGLGV